jgi:acyl-CoA thioesterase FadM
MTITHPPMRDGGVITSAHVPFFLALEAMADAWANALADHCSGVLAPTDLGVVHVDSDFAHEVFVGEVTIDVDLEKVGTSSLTFRVTLTQGGRRAAVMTTVLARVDSTRLHALPLSDAQRAALGTLSLATKCSE